MLPADSRAIIEEFDFLSPMECRGLIDLFHTSQDILIAHEGSFATSYGLHYEDIKENKLFTKVRDRALKLTEKGTNTQLTVISLKDAGQGWHRDNARHLERNTRKRTRTTSIALNNLDGGSLEVMLPTGTTRFYPQFEGRLVSFPAEWPHRVLHPEGGQRYTLMIWITNDHTTFEDARCAKPSSLEEKNSSKGRELGRGGSK